MPDPLLLDQILPTGSWIAAPPARRFHDARGSRSSFRPTSYNHELGRHRHKQCTITGMAADSYPDMLERLFADYEHKHRLPVIEQVAARSRDDLAGQINVEAEPELLERLVRQRLDELPARCRD